MSSRGIGRRSTQTHSTSTPDENAAVLGRAPKEPRGRGRLDDLRALGAPPPAAPAPFREPIRCLCRVAIPRPWDDDIYRLNAWVTLDADDWPIVVTWLRRTQWSRAVRTRPHDLLCQPLGRRGTQRHSGCIAFFACVQLSPVDCVPAFLYPPRDGEVAEWSKALPC